MQKGFAPIIVIIIIAIMGSGAVTVQASQKSVPGDPLYSIKEITENIKIATAGNKAQAYLDLATEKNNELEVLQQRDTSEDKVIKLIEKIQNYNQKISDLLGQAQDKGKDVTKEVERLKTNSDKQKKTLEKVIKKASDKTKEAVQQVIENTQKTVENVVQQQQNTSITANPTSSSTNTFTPTPIISTISSPKPTSSPSSAPAPTSSPILTSTPTPTSSPTPTPTPTPTVTPTPASKPDLVITSASIYNSPIRAGHWSIIQVTVKNQGNAKYFAISNINSSITGSDDSTGCEVGLTGVDPGSSTTFDLGCIAYKVGSHTATIKVDYNSTINESDESNNIYSMNFNVSP